MRSFVYRSFLNKIMAIFELPVFTKKMKGNLHNLFFFIFVHAFGDFLRFFCFYMLIWTVYFDHLLVKIRKVTTKWKVYCFFRQFFSQRQNMELLRLRLKEGGSGYSIKLTFVSSIFGRRYFSFTLTFIFAQKNSYRRREADPRPSAFWPYALTTETGKNPLCVKRHSEQKTFLRLRPL